MRQFLLGLLLRLGAPRLGTAPIAIEQLVVRRQGERHELHCRARNMTHEPMVLTLGVFALEDSAGQRYEADGGGAQLLQPGHAIPVDLGTDLPAGRHLVRLVVTIAGSPPLVATLREEAR